MILILIFVGETIGKRKGENAQFIDFPTYFVYNTSNRKWKQRSYQPSIKSESIGRLPLIGPNSGDVFYLRMLLTHDKCRGCKNERELRTINGILHHTCRDTCRELGLLQTDDEWDNVLIEATNHLSTPAARDTMAYIIM